MGYTFETSLGGQQLYLSVSDRIHLFCDHWDCQRHSNAGYELHIILRGSCAIDIEDRRHHLHANEATVIAPGKYHRPAPDPGEFRRFSMSFSPTGGSILNSLQTAIPASRTFRITQQMSALCEEIFSESESASPFSRENIHALLNQLLIGTFRLLELTGEAHITEQTDRHAAYSELIDDFFEVHLRDDIRADTLAQELKVSRRQLARIMQKTYGMGFREKLISTRMDHAAWLLRSTSASVASIAAEVGYAYEAPFFQAFRAKFHTTPMQYRIQNKEQPDE